MVVLLSLFSQFCIILSGSLVLLHYPIFPGVARAAPLLREEFNPLALAGGGLDDPIPLSDNLLSLSTDDRARGVVCVQSVDSHPHNPRRAGCIFSLVAGALALALRRGGCAWHR